MDSYEKEHRRRTVEGIQEVDRLYERYGRDLVFLASLVVFNPLKPFYFKDYPQVKKRVDKLMASFRGDLNNVIGSGIKAEWAAANGKNDELTRLMFGDKPIPDKAKKAYFNNNHMARDAFLKRKAGGFRISDRVWDLGSGFRADIEQVVDLGLRDGKSAAAMARDLKKYLREPDRLFRRVKDEHGILHLSKRAKEYSPGTGVYRSSYKNALRLAKNEINVAYRTADYERWQQMDFVLGIEVKMSAAHPRRDICDDLGGRYPKDFKFTGWHVGCFCYAVPIVAKQEEFLAIENGELKIENGFSGRVEGVPKGFERWVSENRHKIEKAKYLPDFIRDNPKHVDLKQFKASKAEGLINNSYREYLKHNADRWRRDYFSKENGGYLSVSRQRIEHSKLSKNERVKFKKEHAMATVFAKNGYRIEMLDERTGFSSSDVKINGKTAELKSTKSHNNIVSYAKKATRKQGAEVVLFEFYKETSAIYKELEVLKKKSMKIMYFFTGREDKIYCL